MCSIAKLVRPISILKIDKEMIIVFWTANIQVH